MAAHGLQRVAARAREMAVIDEEGDAALGGEARAEQRGQRLRRRPDFAEAAGRSVAQRRRYRRGGAVRCGAEREGQRAVAAEPDAPFVPAIPGAHELPDRQRTEELV